MIKQPNQYTEFEDIMRFWDKKLNRLEDEMLIYIMQRADLLLEYRTNKLNEEIE